MKKKQYVFLMIILPLLFFGCKEEPIQVDPQDQVDCQESEDLGFVSFNPPNQNIFLYDYSSHEQLIFKNNSGDTLGFYAAPIRIQVKPSIIIDTLTKSNSRWCNDDIRTEFNYEQEKYSAHYKASIGNRSIGFQVDFFATLKKDDFVPAASMNFDHMLSIRVEYDDYATLEIKIEEEYEINEIISEKGFWSVYYGNIQLNSTAYENVFVIEKENSDIRLVYSMTEGLVGFVDKDGMEWTFSHYSFFQKDQASNFILPNQAGEEFSFYDVDGELIILDFWASWCKPCLEEIQSTLLPLHEKYSEKGLTIISISIDHDLEEWRNKVDELGMEWLQLVSLGGFESPLFLDYEIYWIPTIYVIDADKNIISNELKAQELSDFVEQYFD